MQTVEMKAKKRDLSTKGALQNLRAQGEVPAVIYGGQKDPFTLVIGAKEFMQHVKAHGLNFLMNLTSEKGTEMVLVKEVQRDPISRAPLHIDFQRVSMKDKLTVNVPIHVVGEAPGVKLSGGILEHILREVRVRCVASAIPAALEVNVSSLQINQGLRVKDLSLPEGVEVLVEANQLVVNVVAPTILEEPAPGAAAAVPGAAEPEVIAKGKKPEEGAEGAAPAAGAKPAAGAPAGAKPAAGAPAKPAGK